VHVLCDFVLSFCVLLVSLSTMSLRSIHIVTSKFPSFESWVIFRYVYFFWSMVPFYSFIVRVSDCRWVIKHLQNTNKQNDNKRVYLKLNHPKMNSELIHQC
jgi:hypothetical protein